MPSFRDTVKQWFQTRDKPTQAQFYSTWDKIRFNDEKLVYNDLDDNLKAILNGLPQRVQMVQLSANGDVVIPGDCEVMMVTFRSGVSGDIISYSLVDSSGPMEVVTGIDADLEIAANTTFRSMTVFGVTAGQSLRFTGINHLTTIKIYKW